MLDVALEVFTRRDFDAASMDEIAEGAGITKPMLYAYFDSKEGLYLACIDRAAQPIIEAVRDAPDPDLPPDLQLWAGLRAFLAWVGKNPEVWSRFFVQASARGGKAEDRVAEFGRELGAVMAGQFTRTAEAAGVSVREEVDVQAALLIGATQAAARWWVEHPDTPSELVALRVMNFAWMGLGDLMEGRLWLPPADAKRSKP
jgi:AcrR family transcriptional regulator